MNGIKPHVRHNELGRIRPKLIWCIFVPWRYLSICFLLYRIYLWTAFQYEILLVLSVPFLLFYIYQILLLRSSTYIFFDDYFVYNRGVFSLQKDLMEYYRIKDLSLFKSFWMRLIGVERLTIISSDKSNPILFLKGLPNSDMVFWLRNMVEAKRMTSGVYEVDSA